MNHSGVSDSQIIQKKARYTFKECQDSFNKYNCKKLWKAHEPKIYSFAKQNGFINSCAKSGQNVIMEQLIYETNIKNKLSSLLNTINHSITKC